MKIQTITLTPSKASELLKKNTNNRNVKKQRIVLYVNDILNNKGSLDHIKNNDQIRLKLIDGPFLDKNPDWKNKLLKFLFYDARDGLVGVELIGHGKNGNAYPKELTIDLEATNAR